MERLGDNCFAVVGGVFEQRLFRDISVYNIKKKEWHLIAPYNGPIPALWHIKACFENHSLYIMGKERQTDSERQVILEIRFN